MHTHTHTYRSSVLSQRFRSGVGLCNRGKNYNPAGRCKERDDTHLSVDIFCFYNQPKMLVAQPPPPLPQLQTVFKLKLNNLTSRHKWVCGCNNLLSSGSAEVCI